MEYKQSTGSVLVLVLIFCLMTSVIIHLMLETAWLQTKMVNSYQATRLTAVEIESSIITLENTLKNQFITELPAGVEWLQFIPDSLQVGETEGENVYGITKKLRQHDGTVHRRMTTFGVRRNSNQSRVVDQEAPRVNLSAYLAGSDHVALTAVDLPGGGYTTGWYIADKNGAIWWLGIQDLQPKKIFCDYFLAREILGKLLVGRHPAGKGALIYFVALNHQQQAIIYAIDHDKIVFKIEGYQNISPLLLRQNRLIFSESDKLLAFDAFTGEKLIKGEGDKLGRKSWWE